MQDMKQAHYFPLQSQGNVYTIKNIQLINGTNKLLIATLKRQVFLLEYVENMNGILIPSTKEISFTYIPNGAEIISIDVFNKSIERNEFVIGITIIKTNSDNGALETYLNIYSDCEGSKNFNVENIAQNCLTIELNFTPYHLIHTNLITWNEDNFAKETVFLLSGSDNQIHIFKETSNNHSYKKVENRDLFPEFFDVPHIILWLDVFYYDNFAIRLSAFGCEAGYLRLTKVDCKTNSILETFSTQFLSSVPQLRFYIEPNHPKPPNFIKANENDDVKSMKESVNLIVVNSILPAVLFKDVVNNGLNKYVTLRRKDMVNVATCTGIADIDFDGTQEILIGSSFEEILCYKIYPDEAKLFNTMKIVSPVYHLSYIDLTGDGVKELIVLTMKGLYIFQHEAKHIHEILQRKVKKQLCERTLSQ